MLWTAPPPASRCAELRLLFRKCERLFMALSRHSSLCGFMSAFGCKADIVSMGVLCPLLTQSGHRSRWTSPQFARSIPVLCKPSHIGAIVLPGSVSIASVQSVFHDDGRYLDEETERRLRGVATNLIDYVQRHLCPRIALEEMLRRGHAPHWAPPSQELSEGSA